MSNLIILSLPLSCMSLYDENTLEANVLPCREADVGLELVDAGPLADLKHNGDLDLLNLLDECQLVCWRTPTRPRKRKRAPPTCSPAAAAKPGCNCKRSRCLKLYCDCFAAGKPCGPSCNCRDCQNTQAAAPRKVAKPCTCKRNQCRTRYCECFHANRPCTHACQCTGCLNCKQ